MGCRKFSTVRNLNAEHRDIITYTGDNLVLSSEGKDFLEWFRGFTDAEGCFLVSANRGNSFTFKFKIKLHIDDLEVLNFIKESLNIGKVIVSQSKPEATFEVNVHNEIAVIVAIFSKHNLNSTKHLNFLDFSRAFLIYMENNSREARSMVKDDISSIIGNMNSARSNFNLPEDHEIYITSYWLLGFVEGDGSFYYESHKNALFLGIKQKGNKDLLVAIQNFFYDLASVKSSLNYNKESIIRIDLKEKGLFLLSVKGNDFIDSVVIPLFDGIVWHSKKYLDYCDWKVILKIFKLGLHYLPEGKDLISRIISQMNNNRLSTSEFPKIDRNLLLSEITNLLEDSSRSNNYEIKEGRIFIKSLGRYRTDTSPKAVQILEVSNGNVFYSFDSIAKLAKYLNVSYTTAHRRLSSGSSFSFEGNRVYISKKEK